MRLAVISHKVCWRSDASPSGYATDGGFPLQIGAISQLFDATELVAPVSRNGKRDGLASIYGNNLSVRELSTSSGKGVMLKIKFPVWLWRNGRKVWRSIRVADAVHTPIPGDVGTIGLLFALLQRKPLFVRHCGNWMVPRTFAERFWRWIMEACAGGRNVMFATGGSPDPPSAKNGNIRWVFSTSIRQSELDEMQPRDLPVDGSIRLIVACRQEPKKGTDIVIKSLPTLAAEFQNLSLDVVGGGSLLPELRTLAESLGVSDKIRFHGQVTQRRVVELLREAHLFCLPTTASEGFPKAVLEALACGLPVITTRVSVLPTLIGEDCGVLLNDATPANLSDAVRMVAADSVRYRAMSTKALLAAKHYSLENWRDFIGKTLSSAWNVSSLSSTS